MIEIKLYLNGETTLEELRTFVTATESASGEQHITAYEYNGDIDGIAVVVDGL